MKKDRLFCINSLIFLCNSLLCSSPADTTTIIDNIYNFDFLKANEQLSQLNEKGLVKNETLNLEINWWMAIESKNEDRFSEFLDRLNQFEKAGNNDLTKIISSTYRMRYYVCINKRYKLPFLLMKVMNHIQKINIKELEESNHEGFELFIIYKSFLTLIQNNFSIDRFLSDSYRKPELIKNIEDVVRNSSSPNKTIGRYLLMKYYLDIEKDKTKAFSYLIELHKQYPKNLIFTQLLTN